MGNRACPLCFTRVPHSLVLICPNQLECPACHAALELSRGSQIVSSLAGTIAAFLVVGSVDSLTKTPQWWLQVVSAAVAFGFGSAALLCFFADLVVRPERLSALRSSTFPHYPQKPS
jgi:hypothetical protein